MEFYHVDRDLSLQNVKTIELQKVVDPEVFPDFKDGISKHGVRYLTYDFLQPDYFASHAWEWALEYIRKIHFPKMPSRFQMFFAHNNFNDAVQWAKDHSANSLVGIAKIKSDRYFSFDSSWLLSRNIRNLLPAIKTTSFATFCRNCMHYWNQDVSEQPDIEYLLPLPCRIEEYWEFPLEILELQSSEKLDNQR